MHLRSDGGSTTVGDPHNEYGSTLRTFLIADVRGYTRYTEEHGDEGAAELAMRFAELARRGLTGRGGTLVELRGDEALAVFDSARDAIRAAVDLQRLFRAGTDDEPGLPLGVGIGIDAGEAVAVEGGYRGGALNLAARLCSRAAAGEILASETVVSLARRIEGIRLVGRGRERLKGLEEPAEIFEVVPEEALPKLPSTRFSSLRSFRRRHVTRRNAVATGLVALTAAAVAIAVVVTHSDSPRVSSAVRTARVALVVPRSPPGSDDPSAQYQAALYRARSLYDIRTRTFEVDLSKPGLPERVRSSIGNFDLVLLAGQFVDTRFVDEIARHPHTRFVVLDPDPNQDDPIYSAVSRLSNATDVFFIEGPGAYLAGYLSALMAKRRVSGKRPVVVSLIAGDPLVNENPIAGFKDGASDAVPGARILKKYSHDFSHPSVCAAIANRQIDQGSTSVFADAGACSVGALQAAVDRGVWGVGADEDKSYLGPQILVSTVKRLDRGVDYAVRSYLAGTLPQGHLDIGIERDAVGIVGINPIVPAAIRAKLVRVQRQHMKLWTSWATPLK